MEIINLRDYYPFYNEDTFAEVTDEVAAQLRRFELDDAAHRIRSYRAKAYYSLDRGDGIECEAINKPPTPDELLDREQISMLLREAMSTLTPKQARRVYAYAVLGKTKVEIAEAEHIQKTSANESVERGLEKLRRKIQKYF